MKNVTVWELAYELLSAGLTVNEVAKKLHIHRATVYRWKKAIRYRGVRRFVREKKEAKRKRKRRKLSSKVVKLIKKSRLDHHDWCGEKIVWELKTKHGIKVSRASVYRVLNRYFVLRSKWKKNQVRGRVPKASKPRDVIQADTVDFGDIFAYTAVDIFTREVQVVLGDDLTAKEGGKCVHRILTHLGPCLIFQTDNGKEFGQDCSKIILMHALRHRRIHARRKNENAYIESFHRSLRKECLGWIKYTKDEKDQLQELINKYIVYYNTQRPHLGIGLKTPAEVKMSHLR
jgi:transposase InsO family protein